MAAIVFDTTPYAMGFSRKFIGEQPKGRGSWAFEVTEAGGTKRIVWVSNLYSVAKREIAARALEEGWGRVIKVLP